MFANKLFLFILVLQIAIFVGRSLALMLPFGTRPNQNRYLDFVNPQGIHEGILKGWSSFPSDHAVIFFAIVTGLIFVSKRIGVFALFYTLLIIAIPRIYLGLHYPTNILVGGVIGVCIGWLVTKYFPKSGYCSSIYNLSEAKPHFFYPLFFLLSHQIAEMFGDIGHLFSKLYYLTMIL